MAIEITSDTIVKILIRRGQEYDRKLTLLSTGELGYSQDTQRLFVGDGFTLGGVSVGTVFHGFAASKDAYTSIAQNGDTVFQTTDGVLYVFDSDTLSWSSIHPIFGDTIQRYGDHLDISDTLFQTAFTYVPASFIVNPDSINSEAGKVDLNANYISLSAAYSSFYFGNIFQKQVTNNLDATVNVSQNLYINDTAVNPNQLQIWARDSQGNSSIKAIKGDLFLESENNLNVYSSDQQVVQMGYTANGNNFTFLTPITGTFATPNFDIRGLSRFRESSFFDKNLTITGNLSVYGDASYYETTITTTSALSVINANNNYAALVVSQLSPTDDQIISIFNGAASDTNGRPVLTVRDGPFVGINTTTNSNNTTMGANLVVSGTSIFGATPENTASAFIVKTGTGGVTLNATGAGGVSSTVSNFVITNNGTLPGSSKIAVINTGSSNSAVVGLEINSATNTTGIKIVPDASVGAYNPLVGARDAAILSYGGAGTDQSAGLVIGSWSGSTKGIRIDGTSGDVGVGIAASGGYKLNVNGTVYASGLITAGAGVSVVGNLAATGDVIAFNTSDKNLKKNITVIDGALEKIDKISGVHFTWDEEKQTTYTGDDIGVLAQEIEAILPEAVTTREDGYKAVKYDKIIPLLIQAIKELKQQIK
jgi:hypothetical protein